MFSPEFSFPFTKINHCYKTTGDDTYIEYVYAFRGRSKKRYLILVEEYNHFVFVLKFCLQERKVHKDRFNILSGLNECSRILSTMGMLMKELLKNNAYASFGFVGSPLPNEEENNTKRFRIYSRVVQQLVSPIQFEHKMSKSKSAYLLLNKDNQESDLQNKIEEMFDRIYILGE